MKPTIDYYEFFRTSEKSEQFEDRSGPGVVDLKKFGDSIVRRHADLVAKTDQKSETTSSQAKNVKKTKKDYHSPLVRITISELIGSWPYLLWATVLGGQENCCALSDSLFINCVVLNCYSTIIHAVRIRTTSIMLTKPRHCL